MAQKRLKSLTSFRDCDAQMATCEAEDKNFEIFSLIWCDENVNESDENLQIQKKLQQIVNFLKIFDDSVSCELWLQRRFENNNEQIILIISDRLGIDLVPKVHNLSQLILIYILDRNECNNEKWSCKYKKIRATLKHPNELIETLASDQQILDNIEKVSSLSMAIYDSSTWSTNEQSSRILNGNFLWFRLFIETLLRMQNTDDNQRKLVELFQREYIGNDIQTQIIKEFEQTYTSQTALWWYTRNSCIYKILNKALRCQDFHTLIYFQTFITDIDSKLRYLRDNETNTSIIRVYRGQFMSIEEFQRLKSSIDQYVSMNSFLSTSLDRTVAEYYITSSTSTISSIVNNLQRVLFDIEIDRSLRDVKPYADISVESHFKYEKEILFMIGTIFRIDNIIESDLNDISIIRLSLCNENEHGLEKLASYIRMEMSKNNADLFFLGNILREMCEYETATICFDQHLNMLENKFTFEAAYCYTGLGDIARAKGDYDLSIIHHQKAIEIYSNESNNEQVLSIAYNKLGAAFRQKKQYDRALVVYQKALHIQGKYPESEEVATTYYNMGILYEEQDIFYEALKYYKQSLTIRKQYLPSDHYKIARLYRGMGETYYYHGDYALALEHLEKSLDITVKSRTENHYDLGLLYHHIGRVYEDTGKIELSLMNYIEADKIYRHALPSNHEWVLENQQHIDNMTKKENYH